MTQNQLQQVIGNVSRSEGGPSGNIELSIVPNHPSSKFEGSPPILIEEGSKRLVLVRKLDKEGSEGETGIVVGIQCRRLYDSNEPSIIIPVRIIVTDANDHVPQFISAPYMSNISEVTLVGSPIIASGTIRAVDDDQQGPFSTVEYYVEPGPFSHMAKFESPFDGNLLLTSPLDFETLPKFWVTIRAQDQGEPPSFTTTTVTVNVLDADDQNPRFLDDKYTATLPERAGEKLVVNPRNIRAIDPDVNINAPVQLSFSSSSDSSREYSYFSIDYRSGEVILKKSLPPSISLPLTLVVKATQVDNRDRYALTTLTINSRKSPQKAGVRFLQSNYTVSLLENTPAGHIALTVQTTRLDHPSQPGNSFQILDDEESHFSIKPSGEIVVKKPLDYEQRKWYSFRVMVSDGKESDVARVNVTIYNVNDHDPQFSQNHYNFFVSDSLLKTKSAIGEIKAVDADSSDNVTLTIRGPFAQMFSINNDGSIYVESIDNLNTSQCHLIIVATDSGDPPRSSSVPVTVQFSSALLKSYGRSLEEVDNGIEVAIGGAGRAFSPGGGPSTGNGGVPGIGTTGGRGKEVDVNMLLSATGSPALILVIVLGILLATLFIIIISLTVHVLKQRKYPESSGSTSSTGSSGSASPTDPYQQYYQTSRRPSLTTNSTKNRIVPIPEQGSFSPSIVPGLGNRGVENPIFNLNTSAATSNLNSRYFNTSITGGLRGSGVGSEPESGIASDSSDNPRNVADDPNDELVDIRRSQDSSSPPPPPSCVTASSSTTNGSIGSRVNVVKWPQGSIPRRVKKLTWEDELGPGSQTSSPSSSSSPIRSHKEPGRTVTQSSGTNNNLINPSGSGGPFTSSVAIKTTSFGDNNSQSGLPTVSSSSPTPGRDSSEAMTSLRRTIHHQNSGLPDLTVYF